MKKIVAVLLSMAMAVPASSLIAQQQASPPITQQQAQVAQTGPNEPGAAAATSAAIAGVALPLLIGVALVIAIAASSVADDNQVTTATGTR